MSFRNPVKVLLLSILSGFILLSSAFGWEESQDIAYRLKWLANTSTVGDLYADARGMFAENGLKVLVKPGGPERDAIKELELGRAQFGVASADQIIRALSKGAKIYVLAQIFQVNPLQWIYRPDKSPLDKPADLKGKIVGITYGGIDENIMKALLSKYRISESDLTLYSVRYDFTPFYQRKVDLWPIYRNAQGPIIGNKIRDAGEKIDYFDPDAHGIHTVANSVITSEEVLNHHPQMAARFMSALIKGWELSMDPVNAEKAVQTIRQFDRDTDEDIIREQLALTRQFVKPRKDVPFGRIDVPAWKQTEEMMVAQKLILRPIGIDKYLKQAK